MTSHPTRPTHPATRPTTTEPPTEPPPGPDGPFVLGIDVGGTGTRCLVADLVGRRVGVGQAAGANPHAVGMPVALTRIADAVAGALTGLDPARVVASVMGAAGWAAHTPLDARFAQVWATTGVTHLPLVVGDALAGFCAGSSAHDGTVVVSGTGAGAAEVADLEQGLLGDALGWLLGDDGSGQWVGREAVRHLLEPHPGRVRHLPDDPLSRAVQRALLGGEGSRGDVLRTLYAGPPLALSAIAPVVVGLASEGDTDAVRILQDAADLLERSVVRVRRPGDQTPVVLAGGLFASRVLVDALTDRIRRRWPGVPVVRSGSGAGGAAWLACHQPGALAAVGGVEPGPGVHAALTRSPLSTDG